MLGFFAIGGAPIGATARTGPVPVPPPPGDPHLYWRVLVTAADGGYVGFYSCDFQDGYGTSLCNGGAPYASSEYAYYAAGRAFPGGATNWISNNEAAGAWLGYHFAAPVFVARVALCGHGPCNDRPAQPVTAKLQFSDDNQIWVDAFETDRPADGWVYGQPTIYNAPPPAAAADINASEGKVAAIVTTVTASVQASQGRLFGIYTFPATTEQSSQARLFAVNTGRRAIEVSENRVMAVVRGRVADPRVRAWTFTLDGHDFYVLRLGDAATLLYDVATKQWTQWDTPAHGAWRPATGTTWTGAHKLANEFGTNIVAGDDEAGLLWFLDPMQPYDDGVEGGQQAFTRVATGQYLATGRQEIPCYVVFVNGDNYGLTATFQPFVRLDTSDDQGRTFDFHDTLTVSGDNDQPDGWYSLGQFGSPGRIFRITDNGVFARIDAMQMNDDAG